MKISTLVKKVKGKFHSKICVSMSFQNFFSKVVKKNELLMAFQNAALSSSSYRIIVPFEQNACHCYFSEAIGEREQL